MKPTALTIILSIFGFLSMILTGCGDKNHNNGSNIQSAVETNNSSIIQSIFNPMKTTVIHENQPGAYISAVAYNNGIAAYGDKGVIFITEIAHNGNYHQIETLKTDENTSYINALAINESYLLAGSYSAEYVYLYKREANNHFTQLSKIKVDNTSYSPHSRHIALHKNHFVLGNRGGSSAGGEATLYKVENNNTVSKLHTIVRDSNSSCGSGYFASGVAMDEKYIAISEDSGACIRIYHYDNKNGTVKYKENFTPSYAEQNKISHINISLDNGLLLSGSSVYNTASLYAINEKTKGVETILSEVSNSTDSLIGRSVEVAREYLLIESGRGVYIYHYDKTQIKLLKYIQDKENVTWNSSSGMSMQGDTFIRNYSNGKALFIYQLYPDSKIYIYTQPTETIKIPEKEPPYALYKVDADSSDGNLTFSIQGDYANHFEIKGTDLTTIGELEYYQDGNNDYNLTIVIKDSANNRADIPININVNDMSYIFKAKIDGDDYTEGIGSSLFSREGELLTTVGESQIALFKYDTNKKPTLSTIFTSTREDDYSFGENIAFDDNYIYASGLVYKESSDLENGVVDIYKRQEYSDIVIYKNTIKMPTIGERDSWIEQLTLNDSILAVTVNNGYREINHLAVYKMQTNETMTMLQQIKPQNDDNNTYSKFGFRTAMNDNILAVLAPYPHGVSRVEDATAGVYIYTKDKNSTFSFREKLVMDSSEMVEDFGINITMNNDYLVIGTLHGKISIYNILDHKNNAKLITTLSQDRELSDIALYKNDLFISVYGTINHYIINNKSVTFKDTIKPMANSSSSFGDKIIAQKDMIASGGHNFIYLYGKDVE